MKLPLLTEIPTRPPVNTVSSDKWTDTGAFTFFFKISVTRFLYVVINRDIYSDVTSGDNSSYLEENNEQTTRHLSIL